ncbi:MAG: hypothetical protein AAF850_03585 [Pseudomonadota bacterium]
MGDRLKQIWAGFEGVTSRRLTTGGVERIELPHRDESVNDDTEHLPTSFTAPSDAAFVTLRAELEARAAGAASKSGKRKSAKQKEQARHAATEPAFSGSEAAASFNPTSDLMRGLKSTELRTRLPEASYSSHVSSEAGAALSNLAKRKKRFGIF